MKSNFSFSNKRIENILKNIKRNSVIVDVGCDHCYTSIYALKTKKAKFAYNIDINKKPLENGISNIKKQSLFLKTKNFIANGLQTNEIEKKIDFCVISGIGGRNIIDIIENANSDIKIKYFIFVPNNNEYELRIFLQKNGFLEKKTEYVYENNYFYQIMLVKNTKIKKNKLMKNINEKYFLLGKYKRNNKVLEQYISFLIKKYEEIKKKSNSNKNNDKIDLLNLILNKLK
ncbi:MAG: class I SAM-dependent methyltransferase [Mycoplasmataceae bacterium]|jgi:tRNA (adenine22-N1)-methyltransferase|nr:class I SAM-dependent methyltransferase [Mycoplasmataceae bacterium]